MVGNYISCHVYFENIHKMDKCVLCQIFSIFTVHWKEGETIIVTKKLAPF